MAEATSSTVQHRLSAEGADPLLLSGGHDQHLMELSRAGGGRVVLRDEELEDFIGAEPIDASDATWRK